MQVRALSVTGAVALAAAGLVVVPGGTALAAAACSPTAGFDVNHDGVDDTAIGMPNEDVGGSAKDAGSVTIAFGASASRTFGSSSSLLFTQESFGWGSEPGDRFGAALAIGDVNDDGCKDLVIGVPGENEGAGRIQIVYGSPAPSAPLARAISQDSGAVPGIAEPNDEFGAAVAVQGSGSSARLWVGAPGEDLGSVQGAGLLTSFTAGSPGGLVSTTSGMTAFSQDTGGVPGVAEPGDRFGAVLSGSERSLLVGVPREDIGKVADAGAVYAFTNVWTSFSQGSTTPEVPGTSQTGDRFGAAVAQLTSCGLTPGDEAYVVGAPNENVGTAVDAGMVTVVDLPAGSSLQLAQGTVELPATAAEDGDFFGLRVAAAGSLLVASSPAEDLGTTKTNAGSAFQAQMGCDVGVPAVVTSANLTLDTPDVMGDSFKGDRFGLELAFSWTNEGDVQGPSLLVGVPLGADGSVLDSGRVSSLGTTAGGLFVGTDSTNFGQSSPGIYGGQETNDQFGAVIASNGR